MTWDVCLLIMTSQEALPFCMKPLIHWFPIEHWFLYIFPANIALYSSVSFKIQLIIFSFDTVVFWSWNFLFFGVVFLVLSFRDVISHMGPND